MNIHAIGNISASTFKQVMESQQAQRTLISCYMCKASYQLKIHFCIMKQSKPSFYGLEFAFWSIPTCAKPVKYLHLCSLLALLFLHLCSHCQYKIWQRFLPNSQALMYRLYEGMWIPHGPYLLKRSWTSPMCKHLYFTMHDMNLQLTDL